MSEHNVVVDQQIGRKTIRYQATCSCGWTSRRRQVQSAAWNEADSHRKRADVSGRAIDLMAHLQDSLARSKRGARRLPHSEGR